jgi:hypothetical protein
MLTEPLPSNGLFRSYLLLRERMFGELFPSSGLPRWLHYSGLQASCHNMKKYVCVCFFFIHFHTVALISTKLIMMVEGLIMKVLST